MLKAELKHLLSQPLVAKGVSTRYITSGSRPIVDDLIAGECKLSCLVNIQSIWLTHILTDHETMLGLKKAEAGSDLVPRKKKKAKLREKVEEED
jgi:ATP-dependent RNA helicase DDX24/MAK5